MLCFSCFCYEEVNVLIAQKSRFDIFDVTCGTCKNTFAQVAVSPTCLDSKKTKQAFLLLV